MFCSIIMCRHKISLIAVVIIMAAVMAGCRSSQQAARPSGADAEVKTSDLSRRLEQVSASMHPWQSVKMPMSVRLESPVKASLSGTVVMQRDRGISMSLRFMGLMEVGTLTVTDDSITVIDKYHKLYLTESVSGLLAGVDFTVNNLQDILLGRPFVAGDRIFKPASDLTLAKADSETWTVTPPPFEGSWRYSFAFDTFNLLKQLVVSSSGRQRATISYEGGSTDTPAGAVAGKMSVDVPGHRPVRISVTWKTSRAQWNVSQVDFPAVPSGYRRVIPDMLPALLGDL